MPRQPTRTDIRKTFSAKSAKSRGNAAPSMMRELGGVLMSDDSNWLKNPTLPRPPAVPYFEPAELEGMPERDQRFITRTYAREARRQRASRISGVSVTRPSLEDHAAAPARRIA